jgi:hypothetical protein
MSSSEPGRGGRPVEPAAAEAGASRTIAAGAGAAASDGAAGAAGRATADFPAAISKNARWAAARPASDALGVVEG